MTTRNPRRSDEEWMNLIQECRTSGLSDKCWCEDHQIPVSSFYRRVSLLRKKACAIPERQVSRIPIRQELIEITPSELAHIQNPSMESNPGSGLDTAVRIQFRDLRIEITNTAGSETIQNTVAALLKLC